MRTAWRRFLVFGLAFASLGVLMVAPTLRRASSGAGVEWLPLAGGSLDAVLAVLFLRQAVLRRRARLRGPAGF